MDLKAYLEKFESEAKGEIHSFIDFVHAEERKLLAPFHSDEPVVHAPSADDGNSTPSAPVVEAVVEAPAEPEAPVEEAPVVEETPVVEEPVVASDSMNTSPTSISEETSAESTVVNTETDK